MIAKAWYTTEVVMINKRTGVSEIFRSLFLMNLTRNIPMNMRWTNEY